MIIINKPIIEIKNLKKIFKSKNNEITALDNINLQIFKGEIFGIIGLSGAGKSTLVRCMNLLEKPTKGNIIFDNNDLSALKHKELLKIRQSIGMIFQQFNLLMQRNALDNICFPLEISGISKKEARIRAIELLKIVGLEDKANSYPSQLSGGQKQRIAIARAIATNPKVLLCDEATSALDPNTTNSILSLLKQINKQLKITIVIITHEMSIIEQICERVAIIDKSTIAEIGKVSQIFSNPKSEIAKQLIFSNSIYNPFETKNFYRIVFDGISSFEPVITNISLKYKTNINILYADTKNVEGKAIGQMIIQLPEDKALQKRILSYLDIQKIEYEEVIENA